MAFSNKIVAEAFKKAGSRCQCERKGKKHDHSIPCGQELRWEHRGHEGRYAWHPHHRTALKSGGEDIGSNCEILCFECHVGTETYGG